MDKLTPQQFIELMKVMHCMSRDDFFEMMGRNPDCGDPGGYMSDKFNEMKANMFNWLCGLDPLNQHLVFEYAEKKAIWSTLKR